MNEVRIVVVVVVVGYVDALVERVPNSCGLDGGGVVVAVSVVVEDMVLFFFPRRAESGGALFSNNIWLGAFSRLGSWFE